VTRLVWPFVTVQLLLGVLLAKGWPMPLTTLAAWAIVVPLLLGGTVLLATGIQPGSRSPGPLPQRALVPLGCLFLGASLLAASAFLSRRPGGKYFFEIVMTCALMGVLHSVPPIRFNARPGWDLLLKGLGFGFFLPMAGWTSTGRGLEPVLLPLCIGFFFLIAAFTCVFQIHQREEDLRQGRSSLVLVLGVPRSLGYAVGSVVVAHLYFLQAILKHHQPMANAVSGRVLVGSGPSPAFLLLSLAAWLGLLLPWRFGWAAWTSGQIEAGRTRAMAAWCITTISLLLLLWPVS
jgi:hypothetical protein